MSTGRIRRAAAPAPRGRRRGDSREPGPGGWPLGPYLMLLPALAIFAGLFVAPMAYFFVISFWRVRIRKIIPDLTLDNYVTAFEKYLEVGVFTFSIAFTIAFITTVLSFAFAYVVRFRSGRWETALLLVSLFTLFGGYLMKIYAWKTILGVEGMLNTLLIYVGVLDEPLTVLLYSPGAVTVTLVHFLFPLALLPIYASLRGIEPIALEAARDLGASSRRVIVDVVLPQARPGLFAAFAFSFLIAAGDYITPRYIGGPDTAMVGNFIQSAFGLRFDWPLGAAMSFSIITACVLLLVLVNMALRLLERR